MPEPDPFSQAIATEEPPGALGTRQAGRVGAEASHDVCHSLTVKDGEKLIIGNFRRLSFYPGLELVDAGDREGLKAVGGERPAAESPHAVKDLIGLESSDIDERLWRSHPAQI